jgi:hypothetical protein
MCLRRDRKQCAGSDAKSTCVSRRWRDEARPARRGGPGTFHVATHGLSVARASEASRVRRPVEQDEAQQEGQMPGRKMHKPEARWPGFCSDCCTAPGSGQNNDRPSIGVALLETGDRPRLDGGEVRQAGDGVDEAQILGRDAAIGHPVVAGAIDDVLARGRKRSVQPMPNGAAAAAPGFGASSAQACGGFFCSQSQPVNQAAERIVFSQNGDGTVTAVIQILYEGPSENFSWLLPISTVPENDDIAVASDLAFTRLQAATNPNYSLNTRAEGTCRDEGAPRRQVLPGRRYPRRQRPCAEPGRRLGRHRRRFGRRGRVRVDGARPHAGPARQQAAAADSLWQGRCRDHPSVRPSGRARAILATRVCRRRQKVHLLKRRQRLLRAAVGTTRRSAPEERSIVRTA